MTLTPPEVVGEVDVPELLGDLHTVLEGLEDREAQRRLIQVGRNEIRHEKGTRVSGAASSRSTLGRHDDGLHPTSW